MSDSPDALEEILEIFKTSDIVFIGGASHQLLNDKLFINSNLQHFYNAGVRYILTEGGGSTTQTPSDITLTQSFIRLFYPWDYVGVRYGANHLDDEVYLFNRDKNQQDEIRIIGLETGRENFIPGALNLIDMYNYRSEYMANIAFEYIDNAALDEKILILAGGLHGQPEVIHNAWGSLETWKPLGAYLRERYQDKYFSLLYLTLDENIKVDPSFQDLFNSNEWRGMANDQKLVTPLNKLRLAKILPTLGFSDRFDSYIVDKSGIKGVMYGYALFDFDILSEVINQTKSLNAAISLLSKENRLDYSNPNIYYVARDLLLNVYYLKLFFGDNFTYTFWNPRITLNEALSAFESKIFSRDINIQDIMVFPIPSIETLRDYHDYMYYFLSLNENEFWDISIHGDYKSQINIIEPYFIKAENIFPYELWTKYWFATMFFKAGEYDSAYSYLQDILANSLVCSIQNLPEILDLSVRVSDRLDLHEQAIDYRNRMSALWNEHAIDVSKFSLFLD